MPVGWWVRLDAVASCQLGLCLPFSPGSRLIRVLGGGGGIVYVGVNQCKQLIATG